MSSKNLNDFLIRVERTIEIYSKNGNKPLYEINVDCIPLNHLIHIVHSNPNDPLLYDGYELNLDQILSLNRFLPKKIEPDFNLYNYILEAEGIYDWEKMKGD
jgi:hypothetical protein